MHVPLIEHIEDLDVVREAFVDWVSAERTAFFEGGAFIVVAASHDEAARFERRVAQLMRERDLYLTISRFERDPRGRWLEIEIAAAPASDEEIEEELRALADAGEDMTEP